MNVLQIRQYVVMVLASTKSEAILVIVQEAIDTIM